jgi:hypothetical protein
MDHPTNPARPAGAGDLLSWRVDTYGRLLWTAHRSRELAIGWAIASPAERAESGLTDRLPTDIVDLLAEAGRLIELCELIAKEPTIRAAAALVAATTDFVGSYADSRYDRTRISPAEDAVNSALDAARTNFIQLARAEIGTATSE